MTDTDRKAIEEAIRGWYLGEEAERLITILTLPPSTPAHLLAARLAWHNRVRHDDNLMYTEPCPMCKGVWTEHDAERCRKTRPNGETYYE